jgi:hypothetical protein
MKIAKPRYIGTRFLNNLIDDAARNINISSTSSVSTMPGDTSTDVGSDIDTDPIQI